MGGKYYTNYLTDISNVGVVHTTPDFLWFRGFFGSPLMAICRPTITPAQPGHYSLEGNDFNPTHEGAARWHGPKPTSGSFWPIGDATV